MEYIICRYCKHEDCMIRARECPRHKAIRYLLLDVIAEELPRLHRCYTFAEEEMKEDD